ncbi:MAG: DnaB-like helicase C-terminal domain-containing protein, partial [Candidatus Aenigmatarchaeota archaeon]
MNSNIKLNVGLVKGILKAYYLRNSSTTAVRILSLLPKLSNYSVICSVLENFISRGETLDFENLEREIRAYVFQTGRKLSSEEEILISEIKGKGGETYLTSLGTDDFDYIFEKIKEFLKYVEISGFLSSIEKVLSMQSIDADIDSSEFGVDMIIRMMQRSLERVVQVESEAGGLDFLTYDESSLEMRPYVKFTEESQRVMTGLSVIDNSITKGLGLQKGWFSVITAGTGIGKTTFLTNIAAQSFLLGYRVLYISLEMSKEEIAKRIDSIITGIPLIDIDKSIHAVRACQILKERISKAPTRTGVKRDLTIIYFPSFTLSVYQIPIILDEFKIQGKEFDVVIIDFADFFRPENK